MKYKQIKTDVMKKLLFTIVAVLFGIALNAQVSVWDGGAEKWTNGSGTPDDPYLIENAQQFAYLAQQVNALELNNHGVPFDVFADTCFFLATDLDLGGDKGLVWTPIGKEDNIHHIATEFAGHFDGGNHIIYNMYLEFPENKSNINIGLFGHATGGSIRNIELASDCSIDIKCGLLNAQGMRVGGILAVGGDMVLENCISRASIHTDIETSYFGLNCGGLFGGVNNSQIRDCHNYGDVYCSGAVYYGALSSAGIVAGASGCEIFGCTNSGSITCVKSDFGLQENGTVSGGIVGVVCGDCVIEQCCNMGILSVEEEYEQVDIPTSCGGIVGCSYTSINQTDILIKNCYNVGDLSAVNGNTDVQLNYAGGIFGTTYGYWDDDVQNNITIENCYAVGTVAGDTIGGILAHDGWIVFPRSSIVSNSYYINTIGSVNDYGMALAEDYMKSEEFVNMLNTEEMVFVADINGVNNGYPILAIQENYPLYGSEWYYNITTSSGNTAYQCLSYVADTTLSQKKVKVIVKTNTLYYKSYSTMTHEYIYDENSKVYWWNKYLAEFTVLYDFNAKVGDEWDIKVSDKSITMHVDAVGKVEYDGKTYKSLTVSDENDIFSGTIVCGIGHLTSFFPERLLNNKSNYEVDGIRCCWNKGELAYQEGNEDCDAIYDALRVGIEKQNETICSIYPNPTNGTIVIEAENINNISIYNILGEKIFEKAVHGNSFEYNFSSQKAGIYIIKIQNLDGDEFVERIIKL